MSNALVQALWLTVIGMGMTFLSIGALVGGIYLLTRLTRTRPNAPAPLPNEAILTGEEVHMATGPRVEQPVLGSDVDYRRRAAAVAVATALALAEGERQVLPGAPAGSGWDAYVRARHLSSRETYASRRRHG